MAQSIYTVKQVNAYIKNMFTQDYMLNRIYVKGEVSNCKYHTSGHIYFSLKDESGTIACVMFAGQRGGLSFRLSDGQQVVVLGGVNVYERSGSYQLYAREIRPDGDGALYERFQMLKKELEEMGMFAPEYKKPIPEYASRIGVVTAPTGAAVRDIMNIAARRNPYVQLILYPAKVQGEGAKESIVRGIRMLEAAQVDVMIVGRGGGSIEDLWAFNEEEVARAIFDCQIPIISAVGHETDTTIADYAADLRAPTPSAAAELAVYDYRQTQMRMQEYGLSLNRLLTQKVTMNRLRLKECQTKLKYLHPRYKLQVHRQRLDDLEDRLRKQMERRLTDSRHRLALYMEAMKGLSPIQKLNQGYSYVEGRDKTVIKSIKQVQPGDSLSVY
ncbi:exodeoxyribonuclease VII large subunit, partial [Sporofaciens musculi]